MQTVVNSTPFIAVIVIPPVSVYFLPVTIKDLRKVGVNGQTDFYLLFTHFFHWFGTDGDEKNRMKKYKRLSRVAERGVY